MNHKLIRALQQFDIRRTEKLGTSESALFAPGEKGAEMIADTFVPIAWRLYSDIKRWIARQIARQ